MRAVQKKPTYPKGLNLKQVWAALQEITRRQEEIDMQIKEINRKIKEITHQKDTDQKIEKNVEQFEEDELKIEENAEQLEEDELKEEIAKEKNRLWEKWVGEDLYFGDIADYMLLPFLMRKFVKLGLNFFEGKHNYYVSDKDNHISVSADFMMRNDEKEMLVELRKKFTTEDVKEHEKNLEMMRTYADLHGDNGPKSKCAFLGAVAGVVMPPDVKKYALEQGFYVIEPSGIAFKITPPQGKPKEW